MPAARTACRRTGAKANVEAASVPGSVLAQESAVVLRQAVPAAANKALICRARKRSARMVLNAAPARPIAIDVLRAIDVLIVNEEAAAALAQAFRCSSVPEIFLAAACRTGAPIVIVTLQARGALCLIDDELHRVAAPAIDVVDTIGRGRRVRGSARGSARDGAISPAEAARRAVAAGSLACSICGAQPSLPSLKAIECCYLQLQFAALETVTLSPADS